ncbi:aggregation-promoting factor C-terminal-like domain-containing protein [Amycolatopsis speibonae]|uniref:Transglycosylase SLT domain-containing protein n=1 Tax=Amycolatopsis speibonae TaxID=1450224 RepID=A0ABV7P4K7_9PSEU
MSDLSFNIVAMDRAGTTFVKLAEQAERLADKLDKIDGKQVTADVNVRTDESRKALDSFTTRFQLMAAGIVAASPLAGAAIVGGVGAGFIGMAALAQKSNEQVKSTFTTMWQNVVADTGRATAQLVPQIVGAGRQIGATFDRLGPQMQAGFAATGPAIVALTRGLTDFAQNAMPGVTSAMQNSLPIFSGIANAAGTLGTAIGSAVSSVGQHSQAYGTYVQSLGNITSSVLGAVVTIVNDVAEAWAENAGQIDSAVDGVADTVAGLADGALPVFASALDAAATAITTITDILGPVAPLLGTVGAAALAMWGAFKVAEAVSAGIRAVAAGALSMGVAMETGSARAAGMMASMQGVAVTSSTAATAVKAAGASAASASLGFASTASSIAGPLGIALVAGTALWAMFAGSQDGASSSSANLARNLDGVTSALETSNGAINSSVIKSLEAEEGYKKVVEATKDFGISQSDITAAVTKGGPALDGLRTKLQGIIKANQDIVTVAGGEQVTTGNSTSEAADRALLSLNKLVEGFEKSRKSSEENKKALQEHATELTASNEGQQAAGRIARSLGISLDAVSAGFHGVARASGDASVSVQDVAAKFLTAQLNIAKATLTISDGFAQADKQVATAQQGVADASAAYQQSLRGVADAQHSAAQASRAVAQAQQGVVDAQRGVVTAQRAVKDAVEGVASAQQAYARSQEQARDAERSLHDARQQAIQDLKELRLQMEDQTVSEQSARVRLFEAQQKAAGFGITTANVGRIAAGPVTAENLDEVKAAIDLRSAQNSLNNTLNSGAKVRQQLTEAERVGVNGSRGVIAAERQVRDAHQAVQNAAKGVEKAQQAVSDANYGVITANRNLVRAKQAVSDASYAEARAHQGVADAQRQSERAAGNLTRAKDALKEATDNASRSLDLNTAAGQRNIGNLLNLWNQINGQNIPIQDRYNQLIEKTAGAFGISKDKAEEYLRQLGLIPPDFKFGVTAVPSIDAQGLWDDIKAPTSLTGRKQAFAAGGQVFGPGGPTDDRIPAWLSNREYVHPVDAVEHYGVGFMEAVRRKQFPKGWDGAATPRLAGGGMVGLATANLGLADVGSRYQATVHALDVLGWEHPPLLPKYVPPPVAAVGSSIAGSGLAGDRAANREIVRRIFAEMFGWGDQWPATDSLLMGESGYQNTVKNKVSTAYGMFQFLDKTWGGYGIPKTSDPVQQTVAGGRYIKARYGSPNAAYAAWLSRKPHWYADGGLVDAAKRTMYGSYDNGGTLQPGYTMVHNGTGKPENVRTSAQEDGIVTAIRDLRKDLKAAVYEARQGSIDGVVRFEDGALAGKIEATFKQMETMSGVLP